MRNSLFGRLIFSSAILLTIFFGVIAYVSEGVFTTTLVAAKKNRLALESYVLLSGAKVENNKIFMPEEQHETRFNTHESGLYAIISDASNKVLWRSYSAHSLALSASTFSAKGLEAGKNRFIERGDFYVQQHAVSWELVNDKSQLIVFSILEDKSATQAKIDDFKDQIRKWLLGTAAALIAALLLILKWGILPVRQLALGLKAIEMGEATKLEGRFPIELRRLAGNLNGLIETERKQRERYQSTLSDLAHSLKTPLAVIQAELELHPANTPAHELLTLQTTRIDDIIKHQLQRAVVATPHKLSSIIDVQLCVEKIRPAFEKIYADKSVLFKQELSDEAVFKGDQRDLMEILGNLLDNAYKACVNTVKLKTYREPDRIILEVHDDGNGVPVEHRKQILKRGLRADTANAGQGIGLDVVRDIVTSYGGHIHIGDSPLGGAVFQLIFPLSENY